VGGVPRRKNSMRPGGSSRGFYWPRPEGIVAAWSTAYGGEHGPAEANAGWNSRKGVGYGLAFTSVLRRAREAARERRSFREELLTQ
jgi:hypothetical protein